MLISPLPPLGRGAPRGGRLSGLCRFLHRLSLWPLHLRALAPPESGERRGRGANKTGLLCKTASRTVRLSAPPPTPQNWGKVKLKISRLRLEMTGVYLTGSSWPTVLTTAPFSRPTPFPSRPTPSPSPYQGEEHLAVGNSAACVVSFIAYLSGRCIAVR